jgi:predicted membrane-bound spermidine synthase
MFWGISLILMLLWYLGLLTGYTLGGIINILLAVAIIMLVIRVIKEKKYCSYLAACRRR